MHPNKLRVLPLIISLICVIHGIADRDEIPKIHEPLLTAQFFHGRHIQGPHLLHRHQYETNDDNDEDDFKPLLDTSTSDDEGQINSTVRHSSSEHKTGYDSDEDSDEDDRDTRNNFLIHRTAKKRTKIELPFVWHPFKPSFLTNYELNAPVSPVVIAKWSRKPNDILLVVLQQHHKQQPQSQSASSAASCTCGSRNETSSATLNSDDLRRERNESSSSTASVDEPHFTAEWPSSCIWAIVACCSPNNYHFRYGCFAYLSCTVAFWDTEPCQLPMMIEASRQAHSYYSQFVHVQSGKPHPDAENYPATGSGGEEGGDGNNGAGTNATTPSTPASTTNGTTTTTLSSTTTTTTTTTTAAPTTPSPVTTTTAPMTASTELPTTMKEKTSGDKM